MTRSAKKNWSCRLKPKSQDWRYDSWLQSSPIPPFVGLLCASKPSKLLKKTPLTGWSEHRQCFITVLVSSATFNVQSFAFIKEQYFHQYCNYQEMFKDFCKSHLYTSSVFPTLTLCSTLQLSLLLPPGDSDYEVPKLVVTDMHLYERKHKQSVHLHLHIFQTFPFEFFFSINHYKLS